MIFFQGSKEEKNLNLKILNYNTEEGFSSFMWSFP